MKVKFVFVVILHKKMPKYDTNAVKNKHRVLIS